MAQFSVRQVNIANGPLEFISFGYDPMRKEECLAKMKKELPTFIVIGAARSGTTALYNFLRQHPNVFMSDSKEPNYFAFHEGPVAYSGPGAEFVNNSVRDAQTYFNLFAKAPDDSAVGEASPLYLFSPQAPQRIASALPHVRLIAILRNPVEQAYSHYLYARAQMIEPLNDFEAALDAQIERREAGWQPLFQYSDFPRYGAQLSRYRAHFNPESIKLFLYEDFESDPAGVLRQIFRFIGVDDSFVPDTSLRANRGGVPKSALLQWAVMRPNFASKSFGVLLPMSVRRRIRNMISGGNIERPELPASARARLSGELRDDINLLGKLIDRDLSAWQ
jgi:hypothetical protein